MDFPDRACLTHSNSQSCPESTPSPGVRSWPEFSSAQLPSSTNVVVWSSMGGRGTPTVTRGAGEQIGNTGKVPWVDKTLAGTRLPSIKWQQRGGPDSDPFQHYQGASTVSHALTTKSSQSVRFDQTIIYLCDFCIRLRNQLHPFGATSTHFFK